MLEPRLQTPPEPVEGRTHTFPYFPTEEDTSPPARAASATTEEGKKIPCSETDAGLNNNNPCPYLSSKAIDIDKGS
jgi:hypothetical protein